MKTSGETESDCRPEAVVYKADSAGVKTCWERESDCRQECVRQWLLVGRRVKTCGETERNCRGGC